MESALTAGTAEERDAVAEKLDVTAEAYTHSDAADRTLATASARSRRACGRE